MMITITNKKDNNIQDNNVLKPLKIGDTVQGKIIGIARSSVFINLDPQGVGIIYGKEYQEAKHKLENLKKGDNVFGKIIDLENDQGYLEISVSKADKELVWDKLQQKKEDNQTIKIKISGANKGGLLSNIDDVPAFLPVSQLASCHYPQSKKSSDQTETMQMQIFRELQKFIGKDLEVKIYELEPKEKKLILSEKIIELENTANILKNYQVGDIVQGKVSKIVNFGIFIKFPLIQPQEKNTEQGQEIIEGQNNKINEENKSLLQEIEGLIHISELDWDLVTDSNEIAKIGQIIKAKIVKIDQAKVSLSLKELKPSPWKDIEKKYQTGSIVKGKIVKLDTFGALVKLPDKIQGLCHISGFGTKTKMEEELKIGENYDFKILSINPNQYKISLKLE